MSWAKGERGRAGGRGVALAALLALVLAGCGNRELILPGERFDVRTPLDASEDAVNEEPGRVGVPPERDVRDRALPPEDNRAEPITLPRTVDHAAWTHRGGGADHRIAHPALGRADTLAWSADIGAGDSRRGTITADPVVAGGRVFTLDAHATVRAFSTSGQTLWSRDLTRPTDSAGEASGGGLAVAGDRLYVATGFGELHAIDVASGEIAWTQGFDAPVAGAPTVFGDLVYVTSRDSRAFAVRTDTGRLQWQLPGAPSRSVTVSGAGPAVTDRIAIFPFGSAELVATLRQGGVRVWSATLAGQRRGRAYTGYTDITSDPVVVGDVVYAGSASGRLAALSARSGERIWTATEGAMSPVWPVGGAVFLVSDQAQLVRLDDATGEPVWAVDLPFFKARRAGRRKAVYAHHGPVLAGGRLVVASDDGRMRFFDPTDGRLVQSVEIPGGATTNPVVVNGTLYVVSTNGRLLAYR